MVADKKNFVLRCPFCVLGQDFRPLLARTDGRFYCSQCGHTASPRELSYACGCAQCARMSHGAVQLDQRRAR